MKTVSKGFDVILKMEMLGWAGTALVIVAYVPQIRHLYVEKCAWGISISTWVIWLVAGALLLSYCIFRNDTLFTFVQAINITAIIATIISPAEEIGFARITCRWLRAAEIRTR